jgi:hypothetical protein
MSLISATTWPISWASPASALTTEALSSLRESDSLAISAALDLAGGRVDCPGHLTGGSGHALDAARRSLRHFHHLMHARLGRGARLAHRGDDPDQIARGCNHVGQTRAGPFLEGRRRAGERFAALGLRKPVAFGEISRGLGLLKRQSGGIGGLGRVIEAAPQGFRDPDEHGGLDNHDGGVQRHARDRGSATRKDQFGNE